jgi:hypothetical protein
MNTSLLYCSLEQTLPTSLTTRHPPNRTTKDFTAYSIDWVLISWLTIRHLPHAMNCTYFTAFSINWVLPRRSHHEALTSEAAASAPIASPSLYA